MNYIQVKNWNKYQHYSKRNPPWIKLHNNLLDDYEYGCLQDDSKLLLISLYLLASRCNNKIPNDAQWIKQRATIHGKVDLKPLISSRFISIIENDSEMIAECLQDDSEVLQNFTSSGVTETETETENIPSKPNGFDEFYSAYPKKVGKIAAQKAWKKIKQPMSLLPKMLVAIEQQKKSEQWRKNFIPNPATWLNEGRWDDETTTKSEKVYVELQ